MRVAVPRRRFSRRASGLRLGPGEEELEGTLEVLVEDHSRGAVVHHFLNTGRGKIRLLEALGGSDLKGAVTGQQVRARGRRSQDGGSLELRSGERRRIKRDDDGAGQQQHVRPAARARHHGELPGQHGALDRLQRRVPDDVQRGRTAFFQENSYGQTYLTGDVVGPFTLPMSSSVCDQQPDRQSCREGGVKRRREREQLFASRVRVPEQCLRLVGPRQRRRQSVAGLDQRQLRGEGRGA